MKKKVKLLVVILGFMSGYQILAQASEVKLHNSLKEEITVLKSLIDQGTVEESELERISSLLEDLESQVRDLKSGLNRVESKGDPGP